MLTKSQNTTFAVLLYFYFWVILPRLNFICRRFGTLCSIFIGGVSTPPMMMEQTRVFRNFGIQNSDAGESPKSTNTTFRTRRKFEIKNMQSCLYIWLKQQAVAATAQFAVGRTGDPTIHTAGYLHSKNSVTRLESSCSIKSHYAKHLTVCSIFYTTKPCRGKHSTASHISIRSALR